MAAPVLRGKNQICSSFLSLVIAVHVRTARDTQETPVTTSSCASQTDVGALPHSSHAHLKRGDKRLKLCFMTTC